MNNKEDLTLEKLINKNKVNGLFNIDIVNNDGSIDYSVSNHNDVAPWVNDFIMNSIFNTVFTKPNPSAIVPANSLFTNLFSKMVFMYDPENKVQVDNANLPEVVQFYNVPAMTDEYQMFDSIEDGVRKTSVVYEIPLNRMNNVPVNGVYWHDEGGGVVVEPNKNVPSSLEFSQIMNFPSYRYTYYVNQAQETITNVHCQGRYALIQYTRGYIKYRLLDIKERTVIADPLSDEALGITSIFQMTNAPHLFVIFGGIEGTANKIEKNLLVNMRNGTIKEFNCSSTAFPASITAVNSFPDEDGNFYTLSAFDTSSGRITLKKWNLESTNTNIEDVYVETNVIKSNLPKIISDVITTTPFSGTGNFTLHNIGGKIIIRVVSYNIFSGMAAPEITPGFDLDGNLVYGYINPSSLWSSYPGFRILGSYSSKVINATSTEYQFWGGMVPHMSKTAVGHFPVVEKTSDQRMRLTYSFVIDCADLMSKFVAPFGEG